MGGRFAPLQQPQGGSAAQFRRPSSLRTTPPTPPLPPLCGRLNKTCILSSQAAFLRRRCGGGSFAPLTPCRRGGTFKPPAAAELCRPQLGGGLACSAAQSNVRSNRQGLNAVVQKAHQRVHIIASHICHCGSIIAAHGQCCKFCDTVSLRKFFVPCAELSARQAVF